MKQIAFLLGLILMGTTITVANTNKEAKTDKTTITSILAGKVIDENSGEELVGVAVKLLGTNKICYTDFEGSFHFEGLLSGNYQLDIDFISYEKLQTKSIQVDGNEIHELNLKLSQKH